MTTTKQFVCEEYTYEENGKTVVQGGCGVLDCVLFDGYHFGDRALESVMFKAFWKDDELAVDTAEDWESSGYLRGLNKQYWMERALEYAKENDIAICPKCRTDVSVQPVQLGAVMELKEEGEQIKVTLKSIEKLGG